MRAGVAATQQVLMFAGQELEDDALLERDVKIDQYNLADKVGRRGTAMTGCRSLCGHGAAMPSGLLAAVQRLTVH